MKQADAQLLGARAGYLAGRLGWPGAVGVLALALGLAGFGSIWGPLQRSQQQLSTQQDVLKQTLAGLRKAPAQAVAELTPDQWVSQLPDSGDALRFVEAVQAEAQQRGLQIEATEYRSEYLLGGKVLRYRVQMPARGSYPALRGWIEELMYRHPTAALDEFAVRRDAEGSATVTARIQLSHYSRVAR